MRFGSTSVFRLPLPQPSYSPDLPPPLNFFLIPFPKDETQVKGLPFLSCTQDQVRTADSGHKQEQTSRELSRSGKVDITAQGYYFEKDCD